MKEIGKRIVLKAPAGITLRVQEENKEIVIEAIIEKDNYKNPFIPERYLHLRGTWDTGFVIQNMDDGSEFTWIPIGILNGPNLNVKLGRMNWYNSDFSEGGYQEEIPDEFVESVKKYGGCYISSYHASKEDGKLVFKQGNMPWVNINYPDAETAAADYAKDSKDIESIITSGTVFDSLLRWIIKSKTKTHEEVVVDSTSWGNYWNCESSPRNVMPTGIRKNWYALNIYDIAGNVVEWTSEEFARTRRVCRGGSYSHHGDYWPATGRANHNPKDYYDDTSFRAVLYHK